MYMIINEKVERPEFRYTYRSACNRAIELSKRNKNIARVYRIAIKDGKASLSEESQYVNGK